MAILYLTLIFVHYGIFILLMNISSFCVKLTLSIGNNYIIKAFSMQIYFLHTICKFKVIFKISIKKINNMQNKANNSNV